MDYPGNLNLYILYNNKKEESVRLDAAKGKIWNKKKVC